MLQIVPGKRISARKIVEWCEREMKVEIGEKKVGIDPLIDTIVFPESEQRLRWVALPPKFPRKTCNDQNNLNKENKKLFDKEKSLKEIGQNNENNENSIFNDNASLFVAKSPIIRSQHSFKKIKLPSLRKYYCGNSQDKQDKLREGS